MLESWPRYKVQSTQILPEWSAKVEQYIFELPAAFKGKTEYNYRLWL